MDPALREILAALQEQTPDSETEPEPVETPRVGTPTPESLRDQAYLLSSMGERREAADMLRRAVNLADSLEAEPPRMIPLLEAMAEVLWQLGEKVEARLCANRALHLWFSGRPEPVAQVGETAA